MEILVIVFLVLVVTLCLFLILNIISPQKEDSFDRAARFAGDEEEEIASFKERVVEPLQVKISRVGRFLLHVWTVIVLLLVVPWECEEKF